jgi:hypothetical protein
MRVPPVINSRGLLCVFLAMVALVMIASKARAEGHPCPPKHFYCWQVKLFVDETNKSAAVAHVRACGWPEKLIERALKCLVRK